MKTITLLAYNEDVLKRFAAFLANKRLGHAYLFFGPSHSGKFETALAVAKLINCSSPQDGHACEECLCCQKIAKGIHPDIRVLDVGDTPSIKIEDIRLINNEILLRPYEASYKVIIIRDVEKFTAEAANAFLKTLEEPSANSIIILTSSVLERVPSTIRSRCQMVPLRPMGRLSLKQQLLTQGFTEDMAHFLAYFSDGCLGEEMRSQAKEIFRQKNILIDYFIYAKGDDAFLKELFSDKEQVRFALHVLLSWFRDILLLCFGMPKDDIIHYDRREELSKLLSRYTVKQIEKIIRELTETLRLLDENLNVKLPLTLLRELTVAL